MYYVSRQQYFYSQESIVEVTSGGQDFAGADMLVEAYRNLGEGEEFEDPRKAIEAAIRIRDAWRKDSPHDAINIGIGNTGGMGMELEPTTLTDDELRQEANERWDKLPKCDRCGDLIEKKWHVIDDPDFGDFCSENCCDNAWVEEQQERRQEESEDDSDEEDE